MNENKHQIITKIKDKLRQTAPDLTKDQIERRNKILNSEDPEFYAYGHKVAELEKIVREIDNQTECSYEEALELFKNLMSSHIHEEKFAGFLFINRFKRDFNDDIIKIFKKMISKYCDSWAVCDSSMIKVLGPYLAKKGKKDLALSTIKSWANSDLLWVKRASLVIYLKTIMIKKDFDYEFLVELIRTLIIDPELYIQKALAWFLRTCSRYKPKIIFMYLLENKENFSRFLLRESSKTLSNAQRMTLLEKK
jgi:3-methyladenine DNA glycosylase AlkD